jgi:hypothetical protein
MIIFSKGNLVKRRNTMTEFVEKIRSLSKHVSSDISTMIKDHLHEKIEFHELVALIKGHEKTKYSRRQLLGNVYTIYTLNLFPFSLHLEMKGESNPFILQLTISSQEKQVFSYNSYEDKSKKSKMIPLPKPLFDTLAHHPQHHTLKKPL